MSNDNVTDFPSRLSNADASDAESKKTTRMLAIDIEYMGFIMIDDSSYVLENPRDIIQIVAFMQQRGIKVKRED